jgi:hypothetical protein
LRFQSYVDSFPEADPILPLFHTADSERFRTIIETGQIAPPEICDVFGEALVYLFYGRPAFKITIENKEQRNVDEYLPVALILDAAIVPRIERVFPFDSGAFAGGGYRDALHKAAKFSDYELAPTISSARKLVSAFFETNGKYLLGEYIKRLNINSFDQPEVQAHFSLIAGQTKVEIDDRRYSVELQTKDTLELKNGLLAFVVPHRWLDSKMVVDFLKANPKVAPLSYASFLGVSVPITHGAIFERVYDFLKSQKLV